VSDAARAMRDGNIGDVLVTEGGQLVGIMTDRDLVVRVLAEGLDPSRTPLGTVCSRELTTVSPGDAIETAVARMRDSAIRRLPVVEDGRLVGILALGDLAVEREPESVLGTSAPLRPHDSACRSRRQSRTKPVRPWNTRSSCCWRSGHSSAPASS
jgi:signal-transduction protein with cAMP-binding, CBS, and nucleotidyltransferase domain